MVTTNNTLKLKYIFTLFFGLLIFALQGQTLSVVEQLKLKLDTKIDDKVYVDICLRLAVQLMTENTDDAEFYAKRGLEIAKKTNYTHGVAESAMQLGIAKFYQGSYDDAVLNFSTAIKLFENIGEKVYLSKSLKKMGLTKAFQDKYLQGIEFYKRALEIDIALKDTAGISTCYNDIGVMYNYQGDHDMSVEYQKRSLDLCKKLKDKKAIGSRLLNLGVSYEDVSRYQDAIECYQQALEIKKELADKKGISMCLNNLGEVYKELADYKQAISYYEKSLEIDKQLNNKVGIAISLINIGSMHHRQGNENKALEYYKEALALGNQLNNKRVMAHAQNGLGESYNSIGKMDDAIISLQNAKKNSDQANDKSEMAKSTYLLGVVYFNKQNFNEAMIHFNKAAEQHQQLDEQYNYVQDLIKMGESYYYLGNYDKGIELNFKGLIKAKQIASKEHIRQAAENLSKLFASTKNFEEAYKYAQLFKQTHDSIFTWESRKKLSVIENRFELERKEQEIALQNVKLEKQSVELRQNQILQFALLGGLMAVLLIVILIVISYTRLKRAKNLIQNQKNKIEETNEELNQTNEELQVTLDINRRQKDQIENINKKIMGSITYAQNIQNAVLPSTEVLNHLFVNHFVSYKPKDIVSGDFYWTSKIKGKIIFAAADCTGHGVPGAFMSMLGVSFLNEIVNKENITESGQILNKLRVEVIQALQQKGTIGEHRDGMDIAVCVIDTDKNILQFSGAHQGLFVVRSMDKTPIDNDKTIDNGTHALYEFKGDAMPIAMYQRMQPFSETTMDILQGDFLYMFSDGFTDQFGGKYGKRFTKQKFKELILGISYKPFEEQCKSLSTAFDSWKKDHDQLDDVMVVGLEI